MPVVVLLVAYACIMTHYVDLAGLPPGAFVDEASIVLAAKGIALDAHDEHGVLMPLFFQSLGDWKNPVYIYAVALAFKALPQTVVVARGVASTFSLATAALLGVLAWLVCEQGPGTWAYARSREMAVGTFAVAAVTPWLLTVGRTAFEVSALPTLLSAALVFWWKASTGRSWRWAAATGVALGLATYAYTTARMYVPLLCIALALSELPRPRWRLLLAVAVPAAILAVPMALFMHSHPGVLFSRLNLISNFSTAHTWPVRISRFWRVYTSGFAPNFLFHGTWAFLGGEFFDVLAVPLVIGIVALWKVRADPFWRFVILGLILAPVPSAFTSDFSHDLRNLEAVPFYFALMILGTIQLAPLVTRERLVATALVALLAFQSVWFLDDYFTTTPSRMSGWQETGFEQAVQDAVYADDRTHTPIVLSSTLFSAESSDPAAVEEPFALFAGESLPAYRAHGIAGAHARILDLSQRRPPPGSIVISQPEDPAPSGFTLFTVRETYPDAWGQPQTSTAFLVWQAPRRTGS